MSTIKLKKMFRANLGLVLLLLLLSVFAVLSINAVDNSSVVNKSTNANQVKQPETPSINVPPIKAARVEAILEKTSQVAEVEVTQIETTPIEVAKVKVAQVDITPKTTKQKADVKVAKASDTGSGDAKVSDAEILLHDFMQNAKTLRADFTQIVIDEEGRTDDNASSSGVFILARPGKFRWQVTAPSDLLILADGKNLWNYDVDLEQVTVKPIDDTLSSTPAMLLSGESSALDAFTISGSFSTNYADETVQWLELIPIDTHNDFSKLRLGFSNKEIRVMELSTNVGQVIRIEFSNVVRNGDLVDTLFKFSAPDYVDVIGEAR